MRDNQEEFLAQFLKKDALLAEYQMLSQDSDAPVYRMRAITDALQKMWRKDGQCHRYRRTEWN